MPTSHTNQPRRTLLLTGASRGIGHATVKRFSAAGWRVITCSRHPFPENCPWEMGPEDHIQVDLADPDGTLSAIAEIKQRLENGELHALVNNAAISPKAEGGKRLHRPVLHGDYQLEGVRFGYGQDDKRAAIEVGQLRIAAGEKVAILGRNGAGKSSLLQLLAGMYRPQEGSLLLDSLRLELIDPYDVRRDVAFLSQQANLFFGTLRDNLTMGRPNASDEELLEALRLSGALGMVQALPDGLEHMVQEGGRGLSGGQRQSLLLARTLLRQPRVLLLDEPTAWLDEVGEQGLIRHLEPWLASRTLVVATHRPAVLKWVDRIIVVDNGRVVLDDTKQAVLAKLAGGPAAKPGEKAPAVA